MLQNYGTMELRFTMENYGTMGEKLWYYVQNYGIIKLRFTKEKKIVDYQKLRSFYL